MPEFLCSSEISLKTVAVPLAGIQSHDPNNASIVYNRLRYSRYSYQKLHFNDRESQHSCSLWQKSSYQSLRSYGYQTINAKKRGIYDESMPITKSLTSTKLVV